MLVVCGMLVAILPAAGCSYEPADLPVVASLSELSTESLRLRQYGSTISIEQVTSSPNKSYLASYESDGLRVYTRIDLPAEEPPDDGFPVVIFLHGWTGIDRAPGYDFYYEKHRDYGEMVAAYVDAGFAVFVPGWRGHGTVNGIPADGLEFMEAFDNGSYLSPVFYAIDVLNLIDGLQTFDEVPLDLDNINLSSHSQGGDVALITLAVAGEGSNVKNEINAASIWAGTFPSRFTQVHTYHPMESSPEAFMSGDGTWTGTATGMDGSNNPNFVFGYPPDWIETVDRTQWTWQIDNWSKPEVNEAVRFKFTQMYNVVNRHVSDVDNASFEMIVQEDNTFDVVHDPVIEDAMAKIGGFHATSYLSEPVVLQHSDRDFYTFPEWNTDLCTRINDSGGQCHDFEYTGNTHALRISTREWFSGPHAIAGFDTALTRDIALFRGENPANIAAP